MQPLTYIDRAQACRYLGYGNNAPDADTAKRLCACERMLLTAIRPQAIWRIFPLRRQDDALFLEGCALPLPGKDVTAHLQGCTSAALLCATLSASADTCIHTAQITCMTDAVLLDALASAAIEQVCDQAEQALLESFPGTYATWRYSPGYGDFPLSLQTAFLTALNAQKRIGVCATDSNMLVPAKSVTAILGLSDKPLPKGARGCTTCNLRQTCAYRCGGGCRA